METRKIYDSNPQNAILINVCFIRAEAKPFLWRLFFGWRQTKTTDRGEELTFIFSKKEWLEILTYQYFILDIFKNNKEDL